MCNSISIDIQFLNLSHYKLYFRKKSLSRKQSTTSSIHATNHCFSPLHQNTDSPKNPKNLFFFNFSQNSIFYFIKTTSIRVSIGNSLVSEIFSNETLSICVPSIKVLADRKIPISLQMFQQGSNRILSGFLVFRDCSGDNHPSQSCPLTSDSPETHGAFLKMKPSGFFTRVSPQLLTRCPPSKSQGNASYLS